MKKIFLAVSLAAGLAAAAAAQAPAAPADPAGFSDPSFQDFVETSYGYMRPGAAPAAMPGLRDAVASPAPAKPMAARGRYVFVSILTKRSEYSALLGELSSAGFVLKGERTSSRNGVKRTRLVGWVRAGSVAAIRANPGVAGVRVGGGKARPAAAF